MSLAGACTPSIVTSALRQSLSHTLTIDLHNFSHGGRVPLYTTYESVVKFPAIEHDSYDAKSSSDDLLFLPHDDSTDSEDDLIMEPLPNSPEHVPNITPYIIPNKSVILSKTTPKTSIIISDIDMDLTRQKSTSETEPNKNRMRSRSNAKKVRHLTRKSFHHFRIQSITIHDTSTVDEAQEECKTSADEAALNAAMNAMDALDPNEVIEDDGGIAKRPSHQASGTIIIHDPASNSPEPAKKRRVTFQEPDIDPKRDYIEREIITTEETYYRGLDILLNELLIPMFDEEFIEDQYYAQCISNLPELIAFHDKFLTQLIDAYEHEDDTNDDKMFTSIAKVFTSQNKEEFVEIYMKYIRDYDDILKLFGNAAHNNVELQTFLKQKRKERKPLTNYLILPVQRIPRYILLLGDLKKHTKQTDKDYKNIESALELVHQITDEINERQREIENISQCLQIQEALTNLTESLVKPGRAFQKQFVFVKKKNKHQRQFFCFNDIIIVTNHHWTVKEIMDIRTVDIKRNETFNKKKSFRFGGKASNKNKEIHEEVKEERSKFFEFTLLYSNDKPCYYISKAEEDIEEFEKLVKENRLILMDHDLAQEKDTSELRQKLKVVGVSQADDYQQEIKSMRTKRVRCNASADIHDLM